MGWFEDNGFTPELSRENNADYSAYAPYTPQPTYDFYTPQPTYDFYTPDVSGQQEQVAMARPRPPREDGPPPIDAPPPPYVPPTTPQPTSGGSTGGQNQFGNSANLDPAYLEQQIRSAFAAAGKTPTARDIEYWIKKASTPDIYSDGQVRVGWNPYWAERIRTGSASADPSLAGSEGIISNPERYGYGTATAPNGRMYFTRDGAGSAGRARPEIPYTNYGDFFASLNSAPSTSSAFTVPARAALGAAPEFSTIGGFQAPTVPTDLPTWNPKDITAAGAAPTYQGPSAFSYAPPVPGAYTPSGALDAAKAAPTLQDTGKFSYDALKTPDAYGGAKDFTYDPLKSSEAFKLPTGEEALKQDPGYQFRLNQGLGALENSAAAKGMLRTGQTWKGLVDYGQQAGSQEYQNAVNRAQGTYALNQGVRQAEQGQQFGQGLAAQQQNVRQGLDTYTTNAQTQLQAQGQQFGQRLASQQQNAAQNLNQFNAQLAGQGQEFQQRATQQQSNEAQRLAAYQASLAAQQQGYGQAASTAQLNATNAFNAAGLNAANYNAAADRSLQAQGQTNAFGLSAAQLRTAQQQQQFENQFNAANTAYGYANQQNLARNAQAMQGYQTAVNRDLSQQQLDQGWQNLRLTAEQQAFTRQLTAQQQQFMQEFMTRGQSWDDAYRNMVAELEYA